MLACAFAALAVALVPVSSASASVPSVYGGDLSCASKPANGNIRLCSGTTKTWDAQTKIDVNVILPPEPSSVWGAQTRSPARAGASSRPSA